jgi:hypothetical protein
VLKQVDTLLLSPEEAMVEAAGTGQIDWLNNLFDNYTCVALDAIEAAAANGHIDVVSSTLISVRKRISQPNSGKH